MRAFDCPDCGEQVHFFNLECLHSATELGFDWASRELVARGDRPRCANAEPIGCNWLVDAEGELCVACRLTRTRPPDDDADGLRLWARAEADKRWLVFELGELRLPIDGYLDVDGGLAFDLLDSALGPVTTGHAGGVVTLDLAETEASHREATREQMGEPYRTVLGHLRHEVGHYYEEIVAPEGSAERDRVRALLGDDREDYGEALERHYGQGPPPDWADRHVSAYATMHPYEDWAETFAHVLHIRDTLQTAVAYGLRQPFAAFGIRARMDEWTPLMIALNEVNRSMGQGDLYPFVLAPAVVDKLELVDGLVNAGPPS